MYILYTINTTNARGDLTIMATVFKNGIISSNGVNMGKTVITGSSDVGTNISEQTPPDLGAAMDAINMPIPPGVKSVLAKMSGLLGASGGKNALAPANQTLGGNKGGGTTGSDWRVKIALSSKAGYFYNDPANAGVMSPLYKNPEGFKGVIFPYNPTISLSHTARYGNQKLTHSNYDAFFYEGSEVSSIQVDGEFSCQTQTEAQYLLAVVYFLRGCTKMWSGKSQRAGTPPPMVFLNGFGQHYFPNVPCVVTNFTHVMPNDVDYIGTTNGPGNTRMPTNSNIQISLQPIYSRRTLHEDFNLDDFAAGRLVKGGFI
jgi:hypothetical protein